MTLEGEHFQFVGNSLLRTDELLDEVQLAAADSWLVEDGRARSLERHFSRFTNWVSELAPELVADLPAFFELVIGLLPPEGRWFPRIELHWPAASGNSASGNSASRSGEAGLFLRLRTAPDQLGEITLWTLDESDPRLNPLIKGPDLSLCMQLRRKAILHGADEAVLLDAQGRLLEGALSAIVWWRGNTLCAPDHTTAWLASVTREEVFEIANQAGFETRLESVTPEDLSGLEIWALSSLQGIRPVASWINLGGAVGEAKHAEAFQKRLRLTAAPIRK